jgi:RNA polymerase sigma-70 factor (ECF subfamily)
VSNQHDERHPDFAVVASALEGDAAAAETLIQRLGCVPRILHAKNAQMGARLGDEDLRDLAQDTLESVWRRLRTYEGRSSLETWLFTYCQHALLNAVRRIQRRKAAFRETDLDQLLDPRADALAREQRFEALHRGLEQLERPAADVIRLKHFDALTFEQIAERQQLSLSTVKSHYYRGLTKLRALLDRRMREEYA